MKDILRLLTLFRPYWGWGAVGILVSLVSLLANIVLLSLSAWFITTMALAGVTGAAVNYFTPGAIIRACAILRTGGRYGERLITHEATFRFMEEMRLWLYARIEAMPLAEAARYHSGDLLARLRGDIDMLESFYIGIVLPCCVAFIALIAVTTGFALYDGTLAFVQLGLLLTAGVLVPWLSWHAGRPFGRFIVAEKSRMKQQMVENIQGFGEMTVYGMAQQRLNDALQQSAHIIAAQRRLGIMDGMAQGGNQLLANMALWIALVFALYLYQDGLIGKAHIPMLALLALAAFEAVLPLSLALQSLEGSLEAARRLFALEHVPQEADTGQDVPGGPFLLTVEKLCFAYPGTAQNVLQDFSLALHPGKAVLLNGPSGAGKSSLLHLLAGLYEPDGGTIRLNGRDYADIAPETIRRFFGIVPQRPYLFTGTIRTNLLLARPDASDEEVLQACHIACFDETIALQEKGLDTYLGEGGATLSGGEIRRLAIARAVLKDAPCLLLDEPTESLDALTAARLKDRLFAYARDKAMLFISHEKDIDPRFDKIIPLK